jgi:hypothetical protein
VFSAITGEAGVHITGGRHFLQIPRPTNVPKRVLRAMAAPTIDRELLLCEAAA